MSTIRISPQKISNIAPYFVVKATCVQGDVYDRGEVHKSPDAELYMDAEGAFSRYSKPKHFDTSAEAIDFVKAKAKEYQSQDKDKNVYLMIHPNAVLV